jgi:hypothetical protein
MTGKNRHDQDDWAHGIRLRADARGCDGCVRKELGARLGVCVFSILLSPPLAVVLALVSPLRV